MSPDPRELLILPVIIVIAIALIIGVWIGGQGGDIAWIDDFVTMLVGPALFVGGLLAVGVIISEAF